ncbi:hypothetical protein H5410_027170 [Solanum commersonii]|uniref:Uncharacterized protein n=1 Tax=Solanum commersonii TaxID=4109 RepID=A0A9J5Z3N0_SOLCO|nr:hypothetical protein H5410_027170 [Solanum commersonii]
MFRAFDVPLGEGRALVSCDMITRPILATCQLLNEGNQAPAVPPRVHGPVATLLNDFLAAREHTEALCAKLEVSRDVLSVSQGEVARLKDQLAE